MIKDNLSREIAKKIITNLGFSPLSINDCGLNSKILNLNKLIKTEENNTIKQHKIFSGSVFVSESEIKTVTLVNLNSDEESEFFVSFFNEFGLIFNWHDENDPGLFLVKENNSWIEMALINKLNLLIFIECVTDAGYLWKKHSNELDEYNNIVSLINFTTKKDQV